MYNTEERVIRGGVVRGVGGVEWGGQLAAVGTPRTVGVGLCQCCCSPVPV